MTNFINTNAANRADAFDINNTSSFRLAGGDALVTVGGKLMRNKYSKHVESLVDDPDNPDANQQSIENNTFGPEGVQKINSLYAGLQYNRGIVQVNAGLNYTRFELTGYKPACDLRVQCFPQGAVAYRAERTWHQSFAAAVGPGRAVVPAVCQRRAHHARAESAGSILSPTMAAPR